MASHRQRTRARVQFEALEVRIALSHAGAAVEDGTHHNRSGQPAEVSTAKHGADDPANHDANDDKGGAARTAAAAAVRRHPTGPKLAARGRHRGAEHPAGHR